ncbi:MAG: hypothetical protein KJ799_00165 [Bacteroidetes bacterium]|nr:hypothetical protein [Bacteroidota bacterium]MBU1677985.1 hypothetical protein [Bacteroidota bacterium]MBU2505137.1 hypothetical protein [Bacteroidota bacterium]
MDLLPIIYESLLYFLSATAIVVTISYLLFKYRNAGKKAPHQVWEEKTIEFNRQKEQDEKKKKEREEKAQRAKRKSRRRKNYDSTYSDHHRARKKVYGKQADEFKNKQRIMILKNLGPAPMQPLAEGRQYLTSTEEKKKEERKIHYLESDIFKNYAAEDDDKLYTLDIKKKKA